MDRAKYRAFVEAAAREGLAESPWERLTAGLVLGESVCGADAQTSPGQSATTTGVARLATALWNGRGDPVRRGDERRALGEFSRSAQGLGAGCGVAVGAEVVRDEIAGVGGIGGGAE